jgi:hypothetical protein
MVCPTRASFTAFDMVTADSLLTSMVSVSSRQRRIPLDAVVGFSGFEGGAAHAPSSRHTRWCSVSGGGGGWMPRKERERKKERERESVCVCERERERTRESSSRA